MKSIKQVLGWVSIMQATSSPKIIAFVEGTMEKLFINSNFPYVHLVPIDNGITWPLDKIAAKIGSGYAVLGYRFDYVFVWFDREDRSETSAEIKKIVESVLIENGSDLSNVYICIPDRMTENVIISDVTLMQEEFKFDEYCYDHEGKNGKVILKKLFKECGRVYKEVPDGISLLKRLRLSRCQSLAAESVRAFSAPCWWTGV